MPSREKGVSDFDRFKLAASQIVGKLLTWNQVTARRANRKRGRIEKELA